MGRLKGIYRMAWYENHRLVHRTVPALQLLNQNGIETMAVKGLPLIVDYYRNFAVRPMADLDVVVRTNQARRSIALLEAAGWKRNERASDEDLLYRHSMQFLHPEKGELDLHWHLLYEACAEAADEHFWSESKPLAIDGTTSRQLAPTDTLLHIVVHGIRWNPEPPIRWIPDAAVVLRRKDLSIDWGRLVETARMLKLSHRLGLGLQYLSDNGLAPVPGHVLDQLRRQPITLVERIENWIALHDRDRMYDHPLLKYWVIFADYCRREVNGGFAGFAVGLSHYLRYRLGLRGRGEVVRELIQGASRRIARRVRDN